MAFISIQKKIFQGHPKSFSIVMSIYNKRTITSTRRSFIINRILFVRYTRNLVDDGNGKFNLLILCWGEGHGSPIHDHADSHCFMKILEGSLSEVRFTWPKSDAAAYKQTINSSNECKNLKEISRGELHLNEVAYINGK